MEVRNGSMSAAKSSDLRMVLVGKTGAGKSSTGNTILMRKAFKVDSLPESVTRECQTANAVVDGRNVMVVDTPGVYDTSLSPEQMKREIVKCIEMSVPGPHAFLLVVRLGVRFTKEERSAVRWIQENFGEEADRYTVVVFSHVDQLKGKTVEDALKSSKDLQRLVHQCWGTYIEIDNNLNNPTQASELIRKIEAMVENKTDKYYTNEMYEAAQKRIEERERQQEEERREQRRKQRWATFRKFAPLGATGLGASITVAGVVVLATVEAVVMAPVTIAVGSVALLGGFSCMAYTAIRDRRRNVVRTSQPENTPLLGKTLQKKDSLSKFESCGATGQDAATTLAGGVVLATVKAPVTKAVGRIALFGGYCSTAFRKWRDRRRNVLRTGQPDTRPLAGKRQQKKDNIRKFVSVGATGAGAAAMVAGGVVLATVEADVMAPVIITAVGVALVGGLSYLAYGAWRNRERNVVRTSEPENRPLLGNESEE